MKDGPRILAGKAPRVIIVEDHPLMRDALTRVVRDAVDGEVVGVASGRLEALALARSARPDLVLLDLVLPDGNGLDLLRDLRSELPEARVLMVSSFREEDYARRARAAGAVGYVCKESSGEALIAAVRQAWRGGTVASVVGPVASGGGDPMAALSEREMSVLVLVGRGAATREIAASLGVSFKTVEAHRENIKVKLGLTNAVALVQRATLWVNLGR